MSRSRHSSSGRARPPSSSWPSQEPAPFGPTERRAVNQLGLTHLSFRVRDVAGTAARIVELGGAIVEPSRTTIDLGGTALEFRLLHRP